MSLKVGVVRFPGTNCDQDVFGFVEAKGHKAVYLWHQDQFPVKEMDAVILPGGFSYGDYLRSGALAALTPVMKSVRDFAEQGRPVLGICNGFQVLAECSLLPGALVKNSHRRFVDQWVELRIENKNQFWGRACRDQIKLPVAHGDGRYYATDDVLKELEDRGQIWMRYLETPNGSLQDIAGVMNLHKNVAGLMPHPERAIWDWMGGVDGWGFL